jgi:uncharacterized protein
MSIHYFDPSGWIKRHFREVGSGAVNLLFQNGVDDACCELGLIEMAATIVRKGQGNSLPQAVMLTLWGNVQADFAAFRVISMEAGLVNAAIDLAQRRRLRAMDSIHLACALSLRSVDEVIIVSADMELLDAAIAEGLRTLNPAASGP